MLPKLRLLHPFFMMGVVPSTFDPAAFGSSSFEGEGDTRRLQIEAKEYPGIVQGPWGEKSKIRTTDKGQVILDLMWQVDDPEQCKKLNVERIPLQRQSIFLDLTPNGGLDMGPFKNSELNKLRTIWGLNKAGVKWAFQDFIGKPGKVKIVSKPNADDPQNPYFNITAVTAL